MAEKPILFNTEMVRAILDGRKTMTRRIMKKQDYASDDPYCEHSLGFFDTGGNDWACKSCGCGIGPDGHSLFHASYQVDDILWVQETWKVIKLLENMQMQFEYRADNTISKAIDFALDRFKKFKKFADKRGWQSPYFMPKEATRIFLKVKNVRVERLQDITEEDARAEGIREFDLVASNGALKLYGVTSEQPEKSYTAKQEFSYLWDSTIKKQGLGNYGWDANPWVWVIEFERVEAGANA